jgi:5-methylcytosine-specific restriction endonuclease McrA
MADSENSTRQCRGCSQTKDISAYPVTRGRIFFRCKACVQAQIREWHERHKERVRAIKIKYSQANRDKSNASARRSYWENRAEDRKRLNAYQREYRNKNPERHRAHLAKRRKQIRIESAHYTAEDVKLLLAAQRGLCAEPTCRVDLKAGYHVDHIMPLCLGGTNEASNIQVLCPRCNIRKHSKHPIDWAQQNGRLF